MARSFVSLTMTTWGEGWPMTHVVHDGEGGLRLAEAVFFEFALESFPVDAQEFRSAVFIALLCIEDFEDVFPFELSECFPVWVGWRLVG